MKKKDLQAVVEQHLNAPRVLGRLATMLRENNLVAQRHHDGRELSVFWGNRGDYWRCTVFLGKATDLALLQLDLHEDGTFHVEMWEPCSITVSPHENLLCLTRLRS